MSKKSLSIIAVTLAAVMMLTACGNYSTKTEQVTENSTETESSEEVIVASETESEESESVETASTEAASTEESSTEEASTEAASTEESSTEEASTEASTEETIVTGGHIVVIDPGHQLNGDSTKEPNGPGSSTMKARVTGGTRGTTTGVSEYVLTLDIGLQLRDELESRGYTVYLTREVHEVNISNKERAEFATAKNADIVVRIHANGAESSSTNGALALAPSSSNPYVSNLASESQRLSKAVLNAYCDATGMKNLGVQANDTMTGINWCTMPVTIIEMGFMTNARDDANMQDATYQAKMVQGMANGIDAYFGE